MYRPTQHDFELATWMLSSLPDIKGGVPVEDFAVCMLVSAAYMEGKEMIAAEYRMFNDAVRRFLGKTGGMAH